MIKDIITGLQIIQSVEPDACLRSEHDEIWVGSGDDETFNKYNEEQTKQLEELGWNKDEGSGWHCFV